MPISRNYLDISSGFGWTRSMVAAFARVVDSGSSAAARRLNISKSAVSTHVQRLEERLGIRLLKPHHAPTLAD